MDRIEDLLVEDHGTHNTYILHDHPKHALESVL